MQSLCSKLCPQAFIHIPPRNTDIWASKYTPKKFILAPFIIAPNRNEAGQMQDQVRTMKLRYVSNNHVAPLLNS